MRTRSALLSVGAVLLVLFGVDRWDDQLVAGILQRVGAITPSAAAPVSTSTCGPRGDGSVEVAAVLRNDGAGWFALEDEAHAPLNVKAVYNDASSITVEFAVAGTKVRSLIVAPDDTLASAGFSVGASVGLTSAKIDLGRSGLFGTHRVSPMWVSTKNYKLSNLWLFGLLDGAC